MGQEDLSGAAEDRLSQDPGRQDSLHVVPHADRVQ